MDLLGSIVPYLESVESRLHESRNLFEDVFLARVPSKHVVKRARDSSVHGRSQQSHQNTGEGGGERNVIMRCMAVVFREQRPSHPDNDGTKHVQFSPTWQALLARM